MKIDTKNSHSRFLPLVEKAKTIKAKFKVAITNPITETSLAGGIAAAEEGLIQPIFIGNLDTMQKIAKSLGKNLKNYDCINAADSQTSIDISIDLIKTGKAATIMKGHVHSDEFMRAMLSSTNGLRTKRFASHCMILDVPAYHKLAILTDAVINITPSLQVKKDIIQNAIDFANNLGITQPKVAILAAVEYIYENFPTTLEAAILSKMADRKEITGGLVEGPLDFDVAVSKKSAAIKGIDSPVAGDADIFVAPNVESANILVKQMEYFANAETAGLVLGTKIPIIFLSRSATERSRILSCAIAKLLVHNKAKN